MIMSNRGANCMFCFPAIRRLNLKVCLRRLNTDSFAQENSKLAEPITLEGRSWGYACAKGPCRCGNDFQWMQLAAGLILRVPLDLRAFGCSQQMQCYLQLRLRPVLLKSDCPQTGSWSSPGSSCVGNPRLQLLLREKPHSRKCFSAGV